MQHQTVGTNQVETINPNGVSHQGMSEIGSGEARLGCTALEERFARAASALGASRRRLLQGILDNPDETYFLSSRELAKRCNVDPATIVRTTQVLGYKHFADFVADLRSHFVARLTPYALLKAAAREKRSLSGHIVHSLEMESRNLEALNGSLTPQQVIEVARRIESSGRIMVVGIDFAAFLAGLLAYGLVSQGHDAEAPVGTLGNLGQKINLLGAKDLLIAISFGRCLQDTVESVMQAQERGVPTFGITDGDKSPLARFCDTYWIASIANPSLRGSYVAPLAAINALIVACMHVKPARALAAMQRKEKEFKSGRRWYSPPIENSGL
jgi:DNA-binding MurR/RpiR family transcriptional regulator